MEGGGCRAIRGRRVCVCVYLYTRSVQEIRRSDEARRRQPAPAHSKDLLLVPPSRLVLPPVPDSDAHLTRIPVPSLSMLVQLHPEPERSLAVLAVIPFLKHQPSSRHPLLLLLVMMMTRVGSADPKPMHRRRSRRRRLVAVEERGPVFRPCSTRPSERVATAAERG